MERPGVFLTAEWRFLVLLNYTIDPALVQRYVPPGLELDLWHGQAFVSLVGFRFLRTRVLGLPIPGHTEFTEVNLRTYVRRQTDEGWLRGVVFIKEIVPRLAIAAAARLAYGERYVACPMRHAIAARPDPPRQAIDYAWHTRNRWHRLWATTRGAPSPLVAGSEAEFIAEHYWGYGQRAGQVLEYRVEHPPWRAWTALECGHDIDVRVVYGAEFVAPLQAAPHSAFVAEGSPVIVRRPIRLC